MTRRAGGRLGGLMRRGWSAGSLVSLVPLCAALGAGSAAQQQVVESRPSGAPSLDRASVQPAGALAGLRSLALRGTMVYQHDAGQSRALFEFENGELHTLGVGGQLPGIGVLLAVFAKGVIIESDGTRVLFSFNDSAAKSGGYILPPNRSGSTGAASEYFQPMPVAHDPGTAASDVEESRLDATPRPGEVIDETDWDRRFEPKSPH